MKLIIDDQSYDITEALQAATLGDLMNLKLKTRRPEDKFKGVTVQYIQSTFAAVGAKMQEEDFDNLELLGDEDFLGAMTGLIYLARRTAGERIEVSDAADVSFAAFHIEDDDEVTEDPKAPAGGEPDTAP